jgi:lipoprotein NlpI
MRHFTAAFLILLAGAGATFADDLADAERAYKAKDYAKATELAAAAAKADPKSAEALQLLGAAQLALRENAAAVETFTALIKLDPKDSAARDRRGDAHLKLGKFTEAVADYDAFLKDKPKFAPEHWRRGIALYYAGKFEDGVKQFETHKTVNPEDVENAAWHYLCNVKVAGKEKSQKALIDVTQDTRVPMAEIQKLYAGKLKPEDVLAAAEKTKADTALGKSARFYANLYVALWYDAEGDAKKVRSHLTEAVEKYKIGDYMWDVGNAHLKMLRAKDKK